MALSIFSRKAPYQRVASLTVPLLISMTMVLALWNVFMASSALTFRMMCVARWRLLSQGRRVRSMAITRGHSIGSVLTRPSRKKCLRAIAQRSESQTEAIAFDAQTAGIVIHSLWAVRLLDG
jgi:hypothetical protein